MQVIAASSERTSLVSVDFQDDLEETEGFSQSDETAGIPEQLKTEKKAHLCAFEKEELDRGNHLHDLMNKETEEIFVLSKAIEGNLGFETGTKCE